MDDLHDDALVSGLLNDWNQGVSPPVVPNLAERVRKTQSVRAKRPYHAIAVVSILALLGIGSWLGLRSLRSADSSIASSENHADLVASKTRKGETFEHSESKSDWNQEAEMLLAELKSATHQIEAETLALEWEIKIVKAKARLREAKLQQIRTEQARAWLVANVAVLSENEASAIRNRGKIGQP
jgi:hypothetical protein